MCQLQTIYPPTKPSFFISNPTYKYSSASLPEEIRTFDGLFINIHLKNIYNIWMTLLFFTWTTTRGLKLITDTDFSTPDVWFSYNIPAFVQPLAGPSASMILENKTGLLLYKPWRNIYLPKRGIAYYDSKGGSANYALDFTVRFFAPKDQQLVQNVLWHENASAFYLKCKEHSRKG